MNREEELQERKRKRAERWYRSLTPEQRKEVDVVSADPWAFDWMHVFHHLGYVDDNGMLTGLGELKLHQLNLRKWMAEHPRHKTDQSD